jgi:hypothetical protein
MIRQRLCQPGWPQAGALIPPVGVPPFTYKGRAADVKQVARELGVRYVLEGSVRKAGNRVRITGLAHRRNGSIGSRQTMYSTVAVDRRTF